jgi:competence protein ComEC
MLSSRILVARRALATTWFTFTACPPHVLGCAVIAFFLIGVCLGSFALQGGLRALLVIGAAGSFSLLFFVCGRRALAGASLMLIVGAGYMSWRTQTLYADAVFPQSAEAESEVVVLKVVGRDTTQQVIARLLPPFHGKVSLTLRLYPQIVYGDQLRVKGGFRDPPADSRGYYLKEGVVAEASLSVTATVVAKQRGSPVKAALLRFRQMIQDSFYAVLAPESATLMTGLVLGKSGGFSREFTEKLKHTGTTHLVALSGYNISSILRWLLWALVILMPRRYATWVGVVAIIAFVVMTGAEASVVRAACMAGIVLLAERVQRSYAVYTALLCTAAAMVLWNPAVAIFDIGFQLSFGALLGIVYVEPSLRAFCAVTEKPSLFSWKNHALATTAAQLAVLPITALAFGYFSPLSILANILLLEAIPYTMGFGVLIVLAGIFSPILAALVSLPAHLLLTYELGVINFFATLPGGIDIAAVPVGAWLCYYALLVLFVMCYYPRNVATPSTTI